MNDDGNPLKTKSGVLSSPTPPPLPAKPARAWAFGTAGACVCRAEGPRSESLAREGCGGGHPGTDADTGADAGIAASKAAINGRDAEI